MRRMKPDTTATPLQPQDRQHEIGHLRGMITAMCIGLVAAPAVAVELIKSDSGELHLDGTALVGLFHSERNYMLGAKSGDGGSDWQEGSIDIGLRGLRVLEGGASLYGRISLLASATRGDGDAGGYTSGREERLALEDAHLGWRSGTLFPAFGENGVDISFGRQNFAIGDGFLINGDALNLGDAIDRVAGTDLDRGGAYWMAPRKAFDRSAILRLGGEQGLRGDLFWLHSDNKAQAEMELAGANVELVGARGTLALTYIAGLDVDHSLGQTHRDGQKTLSLRAQGNAGIDNLFLSAEYVKQRQGDTTRRDASAWYLEAGWTFADLPWTPAVNLRHTRYGRDFDPLFYGFNRGYGTWFQGEVAANYAGPFGSDARIDHIGLTAAPSETLKLGLNLFNFRDTAGGSGAMDAHELDLYAEWVASDNLIVHPLLGLYRPDRAEAEGGTQFGARRTNVYAQVLLIMPF